MKNNGDAAKQAGFTLLEQLAMLLIFGILIVVTVSFGKYFLSKNHTESYVSTLVSILSYARTEAVATGEKVLFCKSNNKADCQGRWSDGQVIKTESGKLLRIFPSLPKSDQLIWSSSLGKNDAIEWLPTGYTNGQRGTFYYCAGKGAISSMRVVVLNTGRIYSDEMSEGDYRKYCV